MAMPALMESFVQMEKIFLLMAYDYKNRRIPRTNFNFFKKIKHYVNHQANVIFNYYFRHGQSKRQSKKLNFKKQDSNPESKYSCPRRGYLCQSFENF
jgi:hypothetical protein